MEDNNVLETLHSLDPLLIICTHFLSSELIWYTLCIGGDTDNSMLGHLFIHFIIIRRPRKNILRNEKYKG